MQALRTSSPTAPDRGAVAVEFALIVPLLLLLVFGIINFGILFSQQLTLNNAVREGDRRAVVNDATAARTCDGILASVKNDLSGLALNPANVSVKVTQQGFSNANSCGTAFVKTSFGSRANNIPCKGSLTSGGGNGGGNGGGDGEGDGEGGSGGGSGVTALVVEAQSVSTIPVAFPPFPTTITLSSKAVYRCEFTS
jgi:uncharacterized membrane protein YgcG